MDISPRVRACKRTMSKPTEPAMYIRAVKILSTFLLMLVGTVTLAAPAHAFSTDDTYETRARHNPGQPVLALLDYVGTTRVDVRMYLSDRPGDVYCTGGYARLFNANWQQLGNTIMVGSVCAGRTAWTPDKVITTGAGAIAFVQVSFDNAPGAFCIRAYDGSEACR